MKYSEYWLLWLLRVEPLRWTEKSHRAIRYIKSSSTLAFALWGRNKASNGVAHTKVGDKLQVVLKGASVRSRLRSWINILKRFQNISSVYKASMIHNEKPNLTQELYRFIMIYIDQWWSTIGQIQMIWAYELWHHQQEEKIFCQLRAAKSSASSKKATGKLKACVVGQSARRGKLQREKKPKEGNSWSITTWSSRAGSFSSGKYHWMHRRDFFRQTYKLFVKVFCRPPDHPMRRNPPSDQSK